MRQHLLDLRSEGSWKNLEFRTSRWITEQFLGITYAVGMLGSGTSPAKLARLLLTGPASKKHWISQAPAAHNQEEVLDFKTLLEVLVHFEKVSNLKVSIYELLDWLKRASSLPENESASETLRDQSYHSSSKLRSGPPDVAPEKVAVTVYHQSCSFIAYCWFY